MGYQKFSGGYNQPTNLMKLKIKMDSNPTFLLPSGKGTFKVISIYFWKKKTNVGLNSSFLNF